MDFKAYAEGRQKLDRQPRGRALIAMVIMRFRVARDSNRSISKINLYNTHLEGYSMGQIKKFKEKVMYILNIISDRELNTDPAANWNWFWDEVKGWRKLLLLFPRRVVPSSSSGI